MRRILVFSDSHGRPDLMLRILEEDEKEYDSVFHLGDIEGDAERLKSLLNRISPGCALALVRGNCDDFSLEPLFRKADYSRRSWRNAPEEAPQPTENSEDCGPCFYLCHGHRHGSGELMMHGIARTAREAGCGFALFGHTHVPEDRVVDGVRLFNPGSISRPRQADGKPSYGVITISDDGAVTLEHRYPRQWK